VENSTKTNSRERTHGENDHCCSLKRLRRREAKRPVESWEASWNNEVLIFFIRSVSESCSSLRSCVSSWSPWIRYFCPKDFMLKRRIPVIAKSWMKLSFRFIAFAKKVNFFEPTAPAEFGRTEEEEDMVTPLNYCLLSLLVVIQRQPQLKEWASNTVIAPIKTLVFLGLITLLPSTFPKVVILALKKQS